MNKAEDKPKSRALAVAYNVQKHARSKKMASGGEVKASPDAPESLMRPQTGIAKGILAKKKLSAPVEPLEEDEDFFADDSMELSDDATDMSEFDEVPDSPSLIAGIMKRLHNA